MVLLLGSRGRSRSSGSKFGDALRGIVGTVFGSSSLRRREDGRRRGAAVPAWVASALALGCFAGGFLMGDHFGQAKGVKASEALRVSGRTPGLLPEERLSPEAFIVSAYPNLDAGAAKARARALSDYLVGKKLQKARPLEWSAGPSPLWVVAVYFDGPAEQAATKNLLTGLPVDVPDEAFVHLRNTEVEWPKAWPIR
ncbi:MAG TPA: hypothetical protein VFD82_11335 [Planctomycetota bacterium]|nr:hypothetical protein [Planctomycetota bacterium]